MIGKGDRVPAISVGTIMAVYNWSANRARAARHQISEGQVLY